MKETRNIPALTMRAAFEPKSIDAEKRTVELVWTTGARVMRGFYDRYWEELSLDPKHVRMDRLNNGAPFMADHGSTTREQVGVVESATLNGKDGRAVVRFVRAGVDPEADKLFEKIRDGIVQNVSVGYRTLKMEKTEDAADKVPVYRATDWEPFELSAVAMGADDGAGFRSAKAEENACEFITRDSKEGSKMDETEKRAAELKAAAETAAKAERARAMDIRAAVRAARLGEDLAEQMINDGTPVDQARAAVLEKLAAQTEQVRIDPPAPRLEVGEEDREKVLRGAEAALLVRFGQKSLIEAAGRKGRPEFKNVDLDGGEFRAMRLSNIAREMLERAGVNTRRMNDDALIARALTFTRQGENTTSDFAVLLENVMYKTLLGNYALADDTWREFCKTDSVQDFRPSNRYRTGSFSVLPVVPESAEFTSTAIPDGLKRSLTVQTYGQMLALSRQAIVNDDMGAILDTAGKFGRAAGLTIEAAVYALLTANSGLGATYGSNPFFDASNANVNASGSTLGVQGLDADRVVLASQKDISANEYLNLAKYGALTLLVPVGLGGLARNINKSEWDITQSNKFQVANIVKGMFAKVIDTPRLTGTRRYIFADPGDAAALVVAFLNGLDTPFMEQRLGWRVDGNEWKLRLDFGAQFFDPKGAVTNAGV